MYSGLGNPGPSTCTLAGRTVAFDVTELHALYPTHEDYVDRFSNATRDAVKDGWVQPYDAANAVAQVQGSAVPATTYVP
jgi:hypothetical protein